MVENSSRCHHEETGASKFLSTDNTKDPSSSEVFAWRFSCTCRHPYRRCKCLLPCSMGAVGPNRSPTVWFRAGNISQDLLGCTDLCIVMDGLHRLHKQRPHKLHIMKC